jgi:hypothetical protein
MGGKISINGSNYFFLRATNLKFFKQIKENGIKNCGYSPFLLVATISVSSLAS